MFRRVGPASCPGMPGLVLEWLWLLGGHWLSVAWAVGRFSVVGCFRRSWPWPWLYASHTTYSGGMSGIKAQNGVYWRYTGVHTGGYRCRHGGYEWCIGIDLVCMGDI